MSEHEHDRLADELERQADDMQRQGDKLGDQISDVRSDWESKQKDEGVPGADQSDDDQVEKTPPTTGAEGSPSG